MKHHTKVPVTADGITNVRQRACFYPRCKKKGWFTGFKNNNRGGEAWQLVAAAREGRL